MNYKKVLNNLRNASYAKHFSNFEGTITIDLQNGHLCKGEFLFLADKVGHGIKILGLQGYKNALQRGLLYKALRRKGYRV